jgi:DNA-damage-inducible protein J
MTKNSVVRARIDEDIKREAVAVLAELGLTASEAFRILMTRVAKEKALPFDLRLPVRPRPQNGAFPEGPGVLQAEDTNDILGKFGIWSYQCPNEPTEEPS